MAQRRRGDGRSRAILIAAVLFTALPIGMAILNSFKTEGELLRDVLSLPAQLQFTNYSESIRKTDFPRRLANTLVVAAIGVLGIVFFGAAAGYKLARTPGRLAGIIFTLFVSSMLVPFHSIMIPLTRPAAQLRIQGSLAGLGLIYVGLGIPMAVFLCHGFVKPVSREIEEAAIIDGCGDYAVFFRIVVPLLRPVTASVVVLNVLRMWNDYLLPLLMLTDSSDHTLVVSVSMFFGQYTSEWTAVLATLVLALVPARILYITAQKYVIGGISDGAVKG